MSVEKLMEGFEKWASVKFAGTMNFSRSGDADFYISPITRACFEAWQASRAAIEVELPEMKAEGANKAGETMARAMNAGANSMKEIVRAQLKSLGLTVKS
jgi:hypothetical protein